MANRFLVAGGNGQWNSTTNWASLSGAASGASFPVAGDVVAFDSNSGNAAITINVASACASLVMSGTYAGTLTFTSTLTLTSTCTFLSTCTIAGTAGTLILNGTQTITSGGKTLTCALTGGASAGTVTLADDWVVTGLVTFGSTGTVTLAGAGRKITCNGGFRQGGSSGVLAGAVKLVIAGGTWDHLSSGALNNSADLAGNVTVSGTIIMGTSGTPAVTYISGTITTTGSTLTVSGAATLNTAGVTWNNVSLAVAVTYTLSSALAGSGTLTLGSNGTTTIAGAGAINWTGAVSVANSAATATITLNNTGGLTTTGTMTHNNANITWAGTAGWTVGTLTTATLTVSRTHTLTFGNTYTVTTALGNVGATATVRQALVSGTPGSKVVFTVTPGAALTLTCCDPTDIDSSGGGLVTSVGGVITTSLNWSGSVVAGAAGGPSVGLCCPLLGGREETMDVPLDDVVYFDGISSLATGAANDADGTPTFAVYEEATDTDVGVGGNMTKRTSLTGDYRGSFTCSAANGFELGKWYSVIGSATIGTVACKAVLMRFRVVAAEVVAGYPLTDTAKWVGGTIPATSTAGVPDVNLLNWANSAVSAQIKGYPQFIPPVENSGTVSAGSTSTTVVLGSGSGTNDAYKGYYLINTSASPQVRLITGYDGATKTATIAPAWTTTPGTGSGYAVFGAAFADVQTILGTLSPAAAGYVGPDWGQVANKTTANAMTGTTIATTQKVDVETIKTNPVVNAGTITFPAGATLGTSTLTQAQVTGGAYSVQDAACVLGDARIAHLDADVSSRLATSGYAAPLSASGTRSAVGLASANLDAQLATIDADVLTRSVYAGADTGGTTTLLARLTAIRAGYLDNLSGGAVALASGVTVTTNNDKTGYALGAAGADLVLVDGKSLPSAVGYIAASTAGKVSGAGTGTEVFTALDGITTRLTITVDVSGNRTAVVYG